MKELVQQAFDLFSIRLNQGQINALERYQSALLEWNAQYNLTAIHEAGQIRSKHFLDSFSCILAMRGARFRRLIDVGTGAGFPGLPLKILCPDVQVTLVDSVEKKITFCRHIVNSLHLEGVTLIKARAEDVGQNPAHREQYDWAVGRSVAIMSVLAEYLLPLVSVGGHVLAMKGENAPAEAHAAEYAMHILGGKLRQLTPVTLPGVVEQRYLIVVDKVAATSPKFPRRPGIPSKKPLKE